MIEIELSTKLDPARLADLAKDPNHGPVASRLAAIAKSPAVVDAAIAHYKAVRDLHPMHRDVAKRHGFDRDYGAFTGNPADPRTETLDDLLDDNEQLTPEQARSEATDQILSHAESVADWLAKACNTAAGRLPIDAGRFDDIALLSANPAQLWAVAMTGDNRQMQRAMYRLRQLAAAFFNSDIESRAAELLKEAA